MVSHEPWVGTDTPGSGEAVVAIRFIGKPGFAKEKLEKLDFKKLEKKSLNNLFFFF